MQGCARDEHNSGSPEGGGVPPLGTPPPHHPPPLSKTLGVVCRGVPRMNNAGTSAERTRAPVTRRFTNRIVASWLWHGRTRKRHQQEHRPQRPTERSDPTQHAKGRTGDCPGPRKGATTRRTVTWGGGGGLDARRICAGDVPVSRTAGRDESFAPDLTRPHHYNRRITTGGWGGLAMPTPAQPQHTNDGAPRTRKRHQQEHRPQRPTERSDPTQHAKGRTGDCPGPRKEPTTGRNVTRGGEVDSLQWVLPRGLPHCGGHATRSQARRTQLDAWSRTRAGRGLLCAGGGRGGGGGSGTEARPARLLVRRAGGRGGVRGRRVPHMPCGGGGGAEGRPQRLRLEK